MGLIWRLVVRRQLVGSERNYWGFPSYAIDGNCSKGHYTVSWGTVSTVISLLAPCLLSSSWAVACTSRLELSLSPLHKSSTADNSTAPPVPQSLLPPSRCAGTHGGIMAACRPGCCAEHTLVLFQLPWDVKWLDILSIHFGDHRVNIEWIISADNVYIRVWSMLLTCLFRVWACLALIWLWSFFYSIHKQQGVGA